METWQASWIFYATMGLGNICKIRIIILCFELIMFCTVFILYKMNCMANVMKYDLSVKAQLIPIPSFHRCWDLTEGFKSI